jgi:hypothetical protein
LLVIIFSLIVFHHIQNIVTTTTNLARLACLVGVGKTTHTGHDAEHVVVQGVHADLSGAGTRHRVEGHSELEGRLVDTREVARAGRLVLLRAEGKAVHVDTRRRSAAVVLEGLHAVEVGALTLSEAVLAVELHLGNLHGVLALAAHTGVEDHLREQVVDTRLELRRGGKVVGIRTDERGLVGSTHTEHGRRIGGRGDVGALHNRLSTAALREQGHDQTLSGEVIGVVEGLGATDGRNPGRVGAVHEGIALHNPLELLDGVVKVQLHLVGGRGDGLRTSELHLLDEVLVGLLGEAAALLSVEVHVVNIERSSRKRLGGRSAGGANCSLEVLAVLPRLEVHVDANLVVLEGDEGDRKTRVAAEPELEGDVEGLGRGTLARNAGDGRLRARAGGIERDASAALEEHKVVGVTDEGVKGSNITGLRGELGPDLHPVAVLAINALTTNLNLNLLEEAVADVVEPAEALEGARVREGTRRGSEVDLRENNLHVRLVHQIRITIDDRNYALIEVRLTVEGNLNGLHGEVGVALVQNLPEGDLRVARDINILRTIRNKLH